MITLKDNQPTLMTETKEVFAEVESQDFEGVACYRESHRGHGRVEERTYYAVPLPSESVLREKWKNLNTLMMGIFEREVRYMISDLSCADVERYKVSLSRQLGSSSLASGSFIKYRIDSMTFLMGTLK